MPPRDTVVERFISRIRQNPVVASLILAGSIIIALATFTDAVKNIFGLFSRQTPEAARLELSKLSLDYTPKDFIASARKGDTYAVRLYLTAGMDPNTKDDRDNTPLMYAAAGGYEQVLRDLLKKKANVNQRDLHGDTALDWGSRQKPEVIKILLDAGADLDARNRAFVAAARVGNPQVFPVLIKAGISLDQVRTRALFEAAGEHAVGPDQQFGETVKSLIALGTDVNARDSEGRTPLLLAAHNGHLAVAKVLVDGGADINAECNCPNVEEEPRWSPLVAAIRKDRKEIVDFLLAKNAEVNRKSGAGDTPLIAAAGQANVEMVQKLLGKGADVNATDQNGWTPLMEAAISSRSTAVDVMAILVEKGANVNGKDNDCGTALMFAVLEMEADNVQYLITHGADVNARDKAGKTALIVAAEKGFGHPATIRALLQHGARINDRDSQGKTALQHLREMPKGGGWKTEAIQLLRNAGAH